MKRSLIAYFISILIGLTAFYVHAQTWTPLSNFPGNAIDDGCVFSIHQFAYCGTGLTQSWQPTNDFYAFDMGSKQWKTIAAIPSNQGRQYAAGFSIDGKGYVFGGSYASNYLNELWQYTPEENKWIQINSVAPSPRNGMACFSIDGKAYFVGGRLDNGSFTSEVWSYMPASNTWTQLNDFPYGARWRASATHQNGLGYLIFGLDENQSYRNELYSYSPSTDTWTLIDEFPLSGRTYSSLSPFFDDLVIVAGQDSSMDLTNDMWKYSLNTSSWTQLFSIPSFDRRAGIAFSNQVSLFYTTGIDSKQQRTTQTWECSNPTSQVKLKTPPLYSLKQNQSKELLFESNIKNGTIQLIDINGRINYQSNYSDQKHVISLFNLKKGIYIFRLLHNNDSITQKIVVQ